MTIRRILTASLVALSVVFLGFQIFDMEVTAAGIRAVLIILLTVLYYKSAKPKNVLFFSFLITFTVAEVFNFIGWHVPLVPAQMIDYMYYFGNALYITAYALLISQMLSTLNLLEIIKKYPFHILVLIVLDVFCVVVVTNTVISSLSFHEYYLEFIYNAVIMMLLTTALINYIHRDDKKAVNLLMGTIFIFFSEVLQLAYFYISDITLLNVLCSVFLLLAFLFFYLQSLLSDENLK